MLFLLQQEAVGLLYNRIKKILYSLGMECRKLKSDVLTVTYGVEWLLHPSVIGNIQI